MQVSRQDIAGGVLVPVQLTTALRARMPSDGEVFGDQGAAAATGLRGVAWGDFDDGAASFFRFACRHPREVSPRGIQNTLVETAFGGCSVGQKRAGFLVLFRLGLGDHVGDLEVFKDERAILLDQAARLLMQEILATVPRLAVQCRQLTLGPVAPMAATCAPRELLVRFLDLFLGGTRDAWVVDGDSIGEHGIAFQANINAYRLSRTVKGRRRIKGVLHAEHGVPLVSLSFNGAGFDLALDGTMHHDLDMTNLGEGQPQRLLLPLLSPLASSWASPSGHSRLADR